MTTHTSTHPPTFMNVNLHNRKHTEKKRNNYNQTITTTKTTKHNIWKFIPVPVSINNKNKFLKEEKNFFKMFSHPIALSISLSFSVSHYLSVKLVLCVFFSFCLQNLLWYTLITHVNLLTHTHSHTIIRVHTPSFIYGIWLSHT